MPSPVLPGAHCVHEIVYRDVGSVAVIFSPKSTPSRMVDTLLNGEGTMNRG